MLAVQDWKGCISRRLGTQRQTQRHDGGARRFAAVVFALALLTLAALPALARPTCLPCLPWLVAFLCNTQFPLLPCTPVPPPSAGVDLVGVRTRHSAASAWILRVLLTTTFRPWLHRSLQPGPLAPGGGSKLFFADASRSFLTQLLPFNIQFSSIFSCCSHFCMYPAQPLCFTFIYFYMLNNSLCPWHATLYSLFCCNLFRTSARS